MNTSQTHTPDIENKIEQLVDRLNNLGKIIKEIKAPVAKAILQKHFAAYLDTLDSYRQELACRKERQF